MDATKSNPEFRSPAQTIRHGTLKRRDDCGDIEVIRISLTQSAILALTHSQNRPVGLEQEGAVLSTHDLANADKTQTQMQIEKPKRRKYKTT